MRRHVVLAISAALFIGAVLTQETLEAAVSVPPQMTVQGKLTNSSGVPATPGFKLFTFKIFDAQNGGTEIWPAGPEETVPVNTDSLGLWTAELGTVVPLTDPVFAGIDRWLEITVNDGANPPETLSRLKLTTSPFAFRSATSQKADTALSGGGWVHKGTVVRLENAADSIGVGTDSPSANLHVVGTLRASDKANIGPNNANPGAHAFVAGSGDTAGGHFSTVGGGELNVAAATLSTIGGGNVNRVSNEYGTIGGGSENMVTGFVGTIAGGRSNAVSYPYGAVGGGYHNYARAAYSVVAGGGGETDADSNSAWGDYSFIGGGRANTAAGSHAAVGGGQLNRASGIHACVPGGFQNAAVGNSSLAAGTNAKANHTGTFVWSDSSNSDFSSTGDGQFLIRASGGAGIGTEAPSSTLHVNGSLAVGVLTTGNNTALDDSYSLVIVVGGSVPNITLPPASSCPGRLITIKVSVSGGGCTVLSSGGSVEGGASFGLGQGGRATFASNGSDWYVVS